MLSSISRENWLPTSSLYFRFVYVYFILWLYRWNQSEHRISLWSSSFPCVKSPCVDVAFIRKFYYLLQWSKLSVHSVESSSLYTDHKRRTRREHKVCSQVSPATYFTSLRCPAVVHWTMEFLTRRFEEHFHTWVLHTRKIAPNRHFRAFCKMYMVML